MSSTNVFLNQVNKYQNIMERINEVTNNLHTDMNYLSSCQADSEFILEDMYGKTEDVGHEIHVNFLWKKYISPSSSILKINILKIELLRFKILTFLI